MTLRTRAGARPAGRQGRRRWLGRGHRLQPVGQHAIDLAPSDDGSFYNADLDVRIRADGPPSGPVQSVSLAQRKIMMSFRR
jgi:hypothetical protein